MPSKVIATFTIPAVYSYTSQEWEYSSLRFVITAKADQFLVQYVLSITGRS